MRLDFVVGDQYLMVLDLAALEKDFAPCQQMRMKKVVCGTSNLEEAQKLANEEPNV